jgi:hypothetical protein
MRGRVRGASGRTVWVVARRREDDGSYPYVSEVPPDAITKASADGTFELEPAARGTYRVIAFEDQAWNAPPNEAESDPIAPNANVDLTLVTLPRWIHVEPPPGIDLAFPLRATVGIDAEQSVAFLEWNDPKTKKTIAAIEIDAVVLLDEDVDAQKKRDEVREMFVQMTASGQADEPLAIDAASFEDDIAGLRAHGFSMRGEARRSAYWALARSTRIVTSIQCHTFDGTDPRAAAEWLATRVKWRPVPTR